MARMVDTTEYLDMVRELLADGKTAVPVPVAGSSMHPFLHHGDTVYLDIPTTPLKRGDIVLYSRPGGRYILHRIIKVNPDGSYIMMGDAQQEREWIESDAFIYARVTTALHKGKPMTPKSLRWKIFATAWMWVIPFRRKIVQLVTFINKIIR